MIIGPRAIPGLALCIALVTVASLYYAAIGDVPRTFFGGEDTFLIAPPGEKLIGTAGVPQGLVGPLRSLDAVRVASPEVYVATSIAGRSIMARGVDFAAFVAIEDGTLVAGSLPPGEHGALAGVGFARTFDLEPGDDIVIPGSLAQTASRLVVTGILEVEGPAREELLVPIPVARGLAALAPSEVHLIRVATDDRARVKSLVESVAPTFTYSDVTLSSTHLLPGEPATIRANLTNWGRIEAIKLVQVRQEATAIAQKPYRVAPFATIPVEIGFTLPRSGRFNISINPTFVVDVAQSNLTFTQAPDTVVLGERFVVRLKDPRGFPIADATVEIGDASTHTDSQGFATLAATSAGQATLRATGDVSRGEIGVREIYVVDARYARNASGNATQIILPSIELGTTRGASVLVEIENRGGIAGQVSVPLIMKNATVGYANATLRPGARNLTTVTLGPFAPGNYTLGAANGTATARFTVVPGDDPRIEALLRGYDSRANSSGFSAARGDDANEYVKRTVGNITAAVLILSLATGVLASLAAVAILARHLSEHRRSLGVLKSVGARDSYVVDLVGWETARHAAAACAIGVAAGVLSALAIDATGLVRAFGHAVHPAIDWTTLGLILLIGVIVLVVASRALTQHALAAAPDALLRDEPPTPETAR